MASITFSLDTLAVLMLALKEKSGKGLENAHYEMMSALDGTKTAESFKHQMRPVITRANELKTQRDGGGVFQGVKSGTKRAKAETESPAPAAKKQRAPRKPKNDSPETPKGKGQKATQASPDGFNISTEFEDGDGNVVKAEEADDGDDLV
ncbi:hypothetical protein H2201_000517 [Coniosporium apollinis]|uniref:Uncharacterized protein n=2 Tax=Coniosporium TaxID=2810619 RepID=A0ABQ9P3J5_9PEZI|nr:hypothetical protein H2199_001216 [Cladosporium sp. JES 115]KAJ9669166.1 hypothetical protein H2201_000517 [Coniosporium apollinis]